jgi:hypothetical protein
MGEMLDDMDWLLAEIEHHEASYHHQSNRGRLEMIKARLEAAKRAYDEEWKRKALGRE